MKKKLSFMAVALVAIAAFATTMSLTMAKRAAGDPQVLYSWESPDGTPVETGGTATYEHGDGDRLNYPQQGYYTMCLNGKKANIGDETASANAGYMKIAFDKPLAKGDKIDISAFLNKNESKEASVWIIFETGTTAESEKFGDESNLGLATPGAITTKTVVVPDEADGSNYMKLTRGTTGTNLFITKLVVTRESSEPAPTPVEVTDELTYTSLELAGGTSYAEFSGKKLTSDAVYAGQASSGNSKYIQLRATSPAGIVTTTSGGKIKSITVEWNTATTAERALVIYGSNTAYTSSADLYDAEKAGTKLGEIATSDDNKTLTVTGDYTYVGFVSKANAQYIDKITVVWETAGGDTPEPVGPQDIEISPASGDIAAALTEATTGKEVKDITINLTKDVTYTIGASLVAPNSITINGNGATIDASALEAAMITTPTGDLAEWMTGNFTVKDVAIKGLKKSLYASAGKNYLYKDFLIDNCVIEITATGGFEFDFRKGGVAENFTINNSTIYAPTATANSLYTSQSAQRATEAPDVTMQTFAFTNSTLYNLAKSKNFFTHRQNSQKWLTFIAKNSIFVNCGKSGQAIKGMNGGGSSANPTWDIVGNIFNYDGVDTSASEATGDEAEPVKDNVVGVVTFTDAAAGNFGGAFVATEGAFVPAEMPGDPRWTITATATVIPTPVIDAQEMFIGTQKVGLSCTMENTKIFYTTDGTDPTAESTEYTEPFEISETTTVKAIAAYVFAGKNNFSEIASATLTLQTTFATIAELNQLPDGSGFGYTSEALIVAQAAAGANIYTYIKDETGSAVIFDVDGTKSPATALGKKITKDWVGTASIVKGQHQLIPTAALTLTEEEAVTVKYPVVEFSYITAEHAAEVVMLSGVTYSFVNEEELTITKGEEQIAALNKFGLNPGFAKKDVEYNIVGVININEDKAEFWPIEFVEKPTVDIVVEPEAGTDISEAIAEASKGHFVRNITINLAAVDGGSAKYTITKPIEAGANLSINGNGATIDASALEDAFVKTPADNPTEWINDLEFFMNSVNITGLSKPLFYSTGKNRAYNTFSVIYSNIEVAGDVTVFDFTKGSVAVNFSLIQSTIYAPTATTKSLYSSQGGQKATEVSAETVQKFFMVSNTLYNLATGKNFFSHRQSNQTWLTYSVQANVFVNCGKNGQTIRGLNGGQGGKNPTWNVSNNAFNFVTYNEDGTFLSEDTGAKEDNGDADEPIVGTYEGSVYFKDAANADFAISAASAAGAANAGDTRWGTWEPTYYNIAVSETALEYADIAVQATALEDEVVKVTVTEKNGFQMTELIAKVGAQTKLTVTDNSFIMPPANVGIDATFQKVAADYELAPAAGTDIAEALDGLIIRNLKLTLAEGGAYTLTKSIELGGNLEIIGNGAAIDASALEAPFINLSATPYVDPTVESKTDETTGETTETILAYPLDKVAISGAIIKGLSQQLVKSNNLYLVKDLTVENSIVERLGAQKKSLFDFSGGTGGNVINLTVDKSTLYSDATTAHQNGDFFTSQSSKSIDQMGVDVTAEGFTATTAITNSTLYSIANGKTVTTLRKNSQAYMRYVVKNSVIVNSGKSGQFLKGLNAGNAGTDDNWDVDTNLFNFNDDEVAEQKIGSTEENIKNAVHAVVTFTDAAAGDFNMSIFKDPRIAELPAVGDPRWTVSSITSGYAINVDEAIVFGTVTPSKTYSAADETIKLTVTPDEGYELETLVAKIGATEIEIAEDLTFPMPAADVNITATFVAVPKLYIIGGPKEWKLDDMTEMKYNLETQTYEFEYAPATTAYFAFADKQFTAEEAAAEGAWDVFNANNRLALGEGDMDITLDEPMDLKKVNGTLIMKAGTYKISVTKDLKVTITGEIAPIPTGDKLYIMGTGTASGWDNTTEMTFNEATQAFEYEVENNDKIYITFGDAAFTDWATFNANNRLAIAAGDQNAPVGEEFQLIKVEGTLVLEAGAYKISITKDLKCTITATTPSGINAIAVDKLDNAVIYNLQGVRVEKSQAKGGVFIVNGKKTYLK